MELSDLLLEILQSLKTQLDTTPPKTKLLKLAYMCDVEHQRRHGHRISNADWIYYLYGPYVMDYEKVLSDPRFEIEDTETSSGYNASIVQRDGDPTAPADFDERRTISSVVRDFGRLSLNDILDYVYFETEPMMAADQRLEALDFSTVLPKGFYEVRPLKIPLKTEKTIRESFREKVRRARSEGHS